MTWTYSGDPSSSSRDAIRFMIGDTDTTDQLLSNEEINYVLVEQGTLHRSAAECAFAISAKFARLMSRSIGGLSADFSAKHRQYEELGKRLVREDELSPVSPFISGFSRSAKEAEELDTDRETTFSRKGIHDNLRVYPADDYYDGSYRAGR